jgi:heme/copper-type cytochrome/quinol oxidase subunit 2
VGLDNPSPAVTFGQFTAQAALTSFEIDLFGGCARKMPQRTNAIWLPAKASGRCG